MQSLPLHSGRITIDSKMGFINVLKQMMNTAIPLMPTTAYDIWASWDEHILYSFQSNSINPSPIQELVTLSNILLTMH